MFPEKKGSHSPLSDTGLNTDSSTDTMTKEQLLLQFHSIGVELPSTLGITDT